MAEVLQQRYRVVSTLGQGGLGVVYLCEDLRIQGKHWALKQMIPPAPDQLAQARRLFQREVTTLANLRHPNLPVVVDSFEEAGSCFLVMERVAGENLADHVRRCGPLDETEAFACGLVLLEVLEFLHQQDPPVIYRDLKPENVMLTPQGVLKLIDFGLARTYLDEHRRHTLPSGSVGYAPPEQWDPTCQTDARGDLYAWGATLGFLLSGRLPSPNSPLAGLDAGLVELSEPGLQLLRHCVTPAPNDRPPSAAQLAVTVAQHLSRLGARKASWQKRPHASARFARPTLQGLPPPRTSRLAQGFPSLLALSTLAYLFLAVYVLGGYSPDIGLGGANTSGLAQRTGNVEDTGAGDRTRRAGIRTAVPDHYVEALDRYAEATHYYQKADYKHALGSLVQAMRLEPENPRIRLMYENSLALAEARPVIRLPYLCSVSGVDGPEVVTELQGAAVAQHEINQEGGIGHKKLVIEVEDDHSSTSEAIRISERLTAPSSQALMVLGPSNTQRTLAVAPLYNLSRLPLLTPVASGLKVWDSGPYVFGMADSTQRRVRALARYVVYRGYRRIAVLRDPGSRVSAEMAETFRTACLELHRDVELPELPAFHAQTMDFGEALASIPRLKPDMVFLCDYRSKVTARFASQLHQQGLKIALCSQAVPYTRELSEADPSALDGMISSAFFHPQLKTPKMARYVHDFTELFGTGRPTHISTGAYDALCVVAQVLKHATTREAVRKALRSIGTTAPPFEGVAGPFATGRRLDHRSICIIGLQNGQFHLLECLNEPATKSN